MLGAAPGLEETGQHLEGWLAPRDDGLSREKLVLKDVDSEPPGETEAGLVCVGWWQRQQPSNLVQKREGPMEASWGSGDPSEWGSPTTART